MRPKFLCLAMIPSLIYFAPVAQADALSSGLEAYNKGDIAKAIKKWRKSTHPQAAFNIAVLAEAGRIQNCDEVRCAATWYFKGAQAGHIPSITHLAILNFNNGYKDVGLVQFQLAARWNDPLARNLLSQMGETIPDADLYNQAIEQERARQIAAEVARQQMQAQVAQMLGYFIGCGFGSGCAMPVGTRVQSMSATQAPASSSPPISVSRNAAPPTKGRRSSYPQMCPDGTYVSGQCTIAPDGSYVGGQPQIAPDGTYVSGTPRLTPNGDYIGGSGPMIMCPDGGYVAGTSCQLMPDGRYIGR